MDTFAFFVLITMAKLRTALCTTSTGCVDTCVARVNGNYQHCSDCHTYVACSNGYRYIMPCPSNLVWDDVRKRCEWTSLTCNARMYSGMLLQPRHGCVNSCVGQLDGNYQHCSDCHRYVACSNWYKYTMPCPSNLVWDDIRKRCEWMSLTCHIKTPESRKTTFNRTPGNDYI
ncbi:hypothetical protein ACJMK2_025047 [Sinanodonta woodiana]|uniref:Chitin-binding type-2 domain-containing protein n=1 Tax=Sinanodonta woodiana TaxID=1069815 RepID=A0ABD3XIZ8_SINWO